MHWLQDLGRHTAAWVWIVSQKMQKSSISLDSCNALIQHLSEKMRFSCFPVLPGSAQAQAIWGGRPIVKHLLIAYFIGETFLPKKFQNPFIRVNVTASERWDVFETHCSCESVDNSELPSSVEFSSFPSMKTCLTVSRQCYERNFDDRTLPATLKIAPPAQRRWRGPSWQVDASLRRYRVWTSGDFSNNRKNAIFTYPIHARS